MRSKGVFMLIDTHSHVNMMVKKTFDTPLTGDELQSAQKIIFDADAANVKILINVGTSLPESLNCLELAKHYRNNFAAIGIHPNDCTDTWTQELKQIASFLPKAQQHKIVGIGECGLDYHYEGYNKQRQFDAFKAQIELALEYDLALVVHNRDAGEDVLRVLEEYAQNNLRATIHCFSEDLAFARQAIEWGYYLGIGGTVTYPKNNVLREVVETVGLDHIVLETDAPFLPPQPYRGKQNQPANIAYIATYIANLLQTTQQEVATKTTQNACRLFKLDTSTNA
jgi:TatD DNase family protein